MAPIRCGRRFGLCLNGLLMLLTAGYPLLLWFSLDYLQPRSVALLLAALFVLRYLASGRSAGFMVWLTPAAVLFLLVVSWWNQSDGLLLYPVFVSLLFFSVFTLSLYFPPPIVERLARLEDPGLPAKGVAYTRKVTQVWSLFFLLNAAVSLFTVYHGDSWLWSFYNGCLFYVLMGLLMAGEMAVRRKVKASY